MASTGILKSESNTPVRKYRYRVLGGLRYCLDNSHHHTCPTAAGRSRDRQSLCTSIWSAGESTELVLNKDADDEEELE